MRQLFVLVGLSYQHALLLEFYGAQIDPLLPLRYTGRPHFHWQFHWQLVKTVCLLRI